MTDRKEVPKRPSSFVTTAYNEYQKTDYLDDGTTRITVFINGKEHHSYIEDPNKPIPWWKLW